MARLFSWLWGGDEEADTSTSDEWLTDTADEDWLQPDEDQADTLDDDEDQAEEDEEDPEDDDEDPEDDEDDDEDDEDDERERCARCLTKDTPPGAGGLCYSCCEARGICHECGDETPDAPQCAACRSDDGTGPAPTTPARPAEEAHQ